MKRTSEKQMALQLVKLLRGAPDNRLTIREVVHLLPRWGKLTKGDLALSPSRPGERMWHQVLRNIRSHDSGAKYGVRLIVDGFALNPKPPKHVVETLRGIAQEARESRRAS